ncbi:MAG TPA: CBS domain-containing protein [Polyangia bacterium]|jgi:CBS domain-containing protein
MKCRDLMQMELQWVSADANVTDAARVMRDRSVGFLLVGDPIPGRLVGVLTDRDLATRVSAEGKAPNEVRIADVMSRDVITCAEDEGLGEAEARMCESAKARLVVLDGQKNPVGVISLTDILLHDRGGRALKTARAVLSREGGGPHQPVESIRLTPSTPEDEARAMEQPSATVGGSRSGSTKEFGETSFGGTWSNK